MTNVQGLVASMLADFRSADYAAEFKQVKADPEKHKTTRLYKGDNAYSYFAAPRPKRKGAKWVRFCYCKHPNVAGYYLTWREEITVKAGGARSDWEAWKLRKDAREIALHRYRAWLAKNPAKAPKPTLKPYFE